MIAVVLSLKDLGYTVATYYGAAITAAAGIAENECGATPFDNLWLLYVWRIACRLMPVLMIVLLPVLLLLLLPSLPLPPKPRLPLLLLLFAAAAAAAAAPAAAADAAAAAAAAAAAVQLLLCLQQC